MGYIYCYTSPSGKKYVGQTTKTLAQRAENGNHYRECTAFWRAIQKYGWENFTCEILEECETNLLDAREEYYITLLNTLVPYGYNIKCGSQSQFRKLVSQYDLYGNFIQNWPCASEAAKTLGINYHNIIDCCNHRVFRAGPYIWQHPEDTQLELHTSKIQHKRQVVQLTLNGDFIKIWESVGSAQREYGSGVWKVCNKMQKTCKKYLWVYLDEYNGDIPE